MLFVSGVALAQDAPGPSGPRGAPVFEYALAFVATAGVLVLVCYPARRS